VHLLGRPSIDRQPGGYTMRSRKSWALLAYLVLSERPPTRRQLAGLLFEEADDPLRALRWSLSELRRALPGHVTIEGDPVLLRRAPGLSFDVDIVACGGWASAVRLPGLDAELLEGLTIGGAGAFESWLLSEQRSLSVAASALLDEAVESSTSRGDHVAAIGHAVRRVTAAPLDEAGHAQLIRLYRKVGDDVGAQRQYTTCKRMLERELGALPGPALLAALREPSSRIPRHARREATS